MSDQSHVSYDFVPVDAAQVPPSGTIHHFKDYWWAVDPTRGLLFYKRRIGGRLFWSPQANLNGQIAQRLKPDWAEVQLIPSVFVRVDHNGEYVLPRSSRS